jgi:hypothetical protein
MSKSEECGAIGEFPLSHLPKGLAPSAKGLLTLFLLLVLPLSLRAGVWGSFHFGGRTLV